MRIKAAFAIAAVVATVIAMLLPIPRDSDGGAAHASALFSQG
jgi:hypothetical protein